MVCYGVRFMSGKLVYCGTFVKQEQAKIKIRCASCEKKREEYGIVSKEITLEPTVKKPFV